jgi:hypothetical protein
MLFLSLNASKSWAIVHAKQPHSQRYKSALYSAKDISEYRARIDEYLEVRKKMNLPQISQAESRIAGRSFSEASPLEMLRPTGFYRDETPEQSRLREEKRRGPMAKFDRILSPDSRMPRIPHPLSFSELERHGFGDLAGPVVELGGPHRVGRLVGIEWIEPEEEVFVVDESKRPKRIERYALDIKGSLALGGSFEEMMQAAEELDLEEVYR